MNRVQSTIHAIACLFSYFFRFSLSNALWRGTKDCYNKERRENGKIWKKAVARRGSKLAKSGSGSRARTLVKLLNKRHKPILLSNLLWRRMKPPTESKQPGQELRNLVLKFPLRITDLLQSEILHLHHWKRRPKWWSILEYIFSGYFIYFQIISISNLIEKSLKWMISRCRQLRKFLCLGFDSCLFFRNIGHVGE